MRNTDKTKKTYRPCSEWRDLWSRWESGPAKVHDMDLAAACRAAVNDTKSESDWLAAARRAVFYGEPVS